MTTPITLLSTAIDIAIDKSGLDAVRESDIEFMLKVSAASQAGVPCYRPWYVAAKALEQDLATQALTEADGAKFTNQVRVIRSLFDWQQSIDLVDAAEGVVVPAAFSALAAIASLSGETPPVMSIMVG